MGPCKKARPIWIMHTCGHQHRTCLRAHRNLQNHPGLRNPRSPRCARDGKSLLCTPPAQLALKGPNKEAAKRRVVVSETLLRRYQRARLAMHTHCYPNPAPGPSWLLRSFSFFSFIYRLDGLRLDNKVTIQWELTEQPPLEAPSSDLIYISFITIIQIHV